MLNKIPQYEPMINHSGLADKLHSYIEVEKGWLTEYKHTKEFETELANFLNVKHCFTTNNGTISLSLALLAEGIKPGDVVLVPSMTMFATASAVNLIGAKVRFLDVMEGNTIDSDALRHAVNPDVYDVKYHAMIYVTFNGWKPKEYEEIVQICKENNIKLIEDNAQSFGSKDWEGKMINCPEDGVGSFSFSMPKIITAGQGGCLVTNNGKLAKKIKQLRDFGRMKTGSDDNIAFGINSKFTEMQAIVGLSQMENIDDRIIIKKRNYDLFKKHLTNLSPCVIMLNRPEHTVPWFNTIYTEIKDRDLLIDFLAEHGISTRKIYKALDSEGYYKDHDLAEGFNSKYISLTGLWLPSSLTLTEDEIKYICDTIKQFYEVKE